MDHCLEDLSHDQGDPDYQEVSTHDTGGVNGTGSPSHDAGSRMGCPLGVDTKKKTSLKSMVTSQKTIQIQLKTSDVLDREASIHRLVSSCWGLNFSL